MSSKLVLVIGLGRLSTATITALQERGGFRIRGVVRANTKANTEDFVKKGVEVVVGDTGDRAFLKEALNGVYAVLCLAGTFSIEDLEKDKILIDEAEKADVTQFIPAVFVPNPDSLHGVLPVQYVVKRDNVNLLKASKMKWTIPYTGMFTETWFSLFDVPNAKATQYGNPDEPKPWACYKDLGKFLAYSIGNEKVFNKDVNFSTENLSFNQVLSYVEKATNKKFEVVRSSPQELKQQWQSAEEGTLPKIMGGVHHAVSVLKSFDLDVLKVVYPEVFKEIFTVEQYAQKLAVTD